MESRQFIKAVIRWWWLGIVPVIIVLLYVAVTFQQPLASYGVTMRFATGGEPAATLSYDYDRYYAWLSSEYIANGLADIASSDNFAAYVAAQLSENAFKISPAAVRAAIGSDNTQSTLFIYVTWHDQEQAVELAEAISDALMTTGPVFYPQMSRLGPVARLIDTPAAYPLPTSLRAQLTGPALRLFLAVGVGLGLILLAYVLDPFIHEPADLIARNIPYLGSIPKN